MPDKGFPYRHISVLVMPTDYCNMNCVYCFNGRRTGREKKVMSAETLGQLFRIVIPCYDDIRFIWHGGEPLSVGRAFYENALAMQAAENTRGARIKNSIQTNLTLLDEDMAAFLVDHDFHIGSSFDGTTNEATRHNSARILAGHELVKKAGGRNGFICVVQSRNVDHLIEDYEWFKSRGIGYTLNQYLTAPPYEKDPLFVPADRYVSRMCGFFDYWMYDTSCNIGVSCFETYLNYILLRHKELCSYNSCMGKHVGIHYDGRIYGCNRDFPEEYCFGNVSDYTDIRQCFASDGFKALLREAVRRRDECRSRCRLFEFCAGGCNSCALAGGQISRPNEYVCQTLIPIYDHIQRQIEPWRTASEEELTARLNPYLCKVIRDHQRWIAGGGQPA